MLNCRSSLDNPDWYVLFKLNNIKTSYLNNFIKFFNFVVISHIVAEIVAGIVNCLYIHFFDFGDR